MVLPRGQASSFDRTPCASRIPTTPMRVMPPKIQDECWQRSDCSTTHPRYCLSLSVPTNERGVRQQAVQSGLIFRRVEKSLDGVEDFGIEHTPDTNRVAIVVVTEPIQKTIDRFGFRLKVFESFAINPTQISVFHAFLDSTIFSVRQAAGNRRFVLC